MEETMSQISAFIPARNQMLLKGANLSYKSG